MNCQIQNNNQFTNNHCKWFLIESINLVWRLISCLNQFVHCENFHKKHAGFIIIGAPFSAQQRPFLPVPVLKFIPTPSKSKQCRISHRAKNKTASYNIYSLSRPLWPFEYICNINVNKNGRRPNRPDRPADRFRHGGSHIRPVKLNNAPPKMGGLFWHNFCPL